MTAAPLTVRLASPDDLAAVWALCRTVKQQLAADGIAIWDEEYPTEEIFAGDIAAGELLVAECSGTLVGALAFSTDHAGEYYFDLTPCAAADAARALLARAGTTPQQAVGLHRLMVHPDARRCGAARALLAAVPRYCPGKAITLLAADCNTPALTLYRALGAQDCGTAPFGFGSMRLFRLP